MTEHSGWMILFSKNCHSSLYFCMVQHRISNTCNITTATAKDFICTCTSYLIKSLGRQRSILNYTVPFLLYKLLRLKPLPHQNLLVPHAHHWLASSDSQMTPWCRGCLYTRCAVFYLAPAAFWIAQVSCYTCEECGGLLTLGPAETGKQSDELSTYHTLSHIRPETESFGFHSTKYNNNSSSGMSSFHNSWSWNVDGWSTFSVAPTFSIHIIRALLDHCDQKFFLQKTDLHILKFVYRINGYNILLFIV